MKSLTRSVKLSRIWKMKGLVLTNTLHRDKLTTHEKPMKLITLHYTNKSVGLEKNESLLTDLSWLIMRQSGEALNMVIILAYKMKVGHLKIVMTMRVVMKIKRKRTKKKKTRKKTEKRMQKRIEKIKILRKNERSKRRMNEGNEKRNDSDEKMK